MKGKNIVWPLLGLLFLLTLAGCGGKEKAPQTYAIGEDSLPALGYETEGEAQTLDCASQTDEETGETSYVYSGLESGKDAIKGYVDVLLQQYDCSVIDESGVIQEEPTFSEETGTVCVGKDDTAQDGIFQVVLAWSADGCTVTPSILEGKSVTENRVEALTVEEAVDELEGMSPSRLGLSGDTMKDYTVYCEDGYVEVDDQPCFRLNVYDAATHGIQGTYMLSVDGKILYQLDRERDQVSEVMEF